MAEPDEALDRGRDGLRCFRVLGPRHDRFTTTPVPWRTAPRRYDEQAGLRTTPLREDATTVRRVAAQLSAELAAAEAQRRVVAAGWTGTSADAAHRALGATGTSAVALSTWLEDVATALEDCADRVEALVGEKADHVAGLRADEVAGTRVEQLDDLVDVAAGSGTDPSVDDRVRALAPWFADRGAQHLATLPEPLTESRARAVELAQDDLRGRVGPAIETLWDDFDRACSRAEEGTRLALADLAAVLERSPAGPLPVSPAGPAATGSDGPAGPDDAVTPAATTAQSAHAAPGPVDLGGAGDLTTPDDAGSGATLAGSDPGQGPDGAGADAGSGAVLAGSDGPGSGGSGSGGSGSAGPGVPASPGAAADAWTPLRGVGRWPWDDPFTAVDDHAPAERFSLAALLRLWDDVVLERR